MATVKKIVTYFESIVLPEMKMDFDNVGLLVGINETEVKTALVALDVTDGVIDEAVACGAQMILSHHPIFFELKQVNDGSPAGRKVTKLLQNGISAFCQHTNLDSVSGGVNDALAATLSVSVKGRLVDQITGGGIEYGMGRYGELANPISLEEFMIFVKSSLCAGGIRYYDAGRLVKKVALCGGSGGEYVETAAKLGCDTLVTADVKYHQFLAAKELGINLLDAGHFCTENVVVPVIADMLKKAFPDVNVLISRTHTQTVRFF
ncbi:MAG: Nif3-like dinuclear metal center hexameric protein [Clostridia bacterium]|nr:Nif3-like dinuclear metal center hexameric protein [Clostridia bacterium]